MSDHFIYLDNNATTRIDPRVLEAMMPFLQGEYGNAASATHEMGRNANAAVEAARSCLAAAIQASPDEIVFTSGATESNNLALRGASLHRSMKSKRILSSSIEHRAVLDPLRRLAKEGFDVRFLSSFHRDGQITDEELGTTGTETYGLISFMLSNNEIGTLNPLRKICDKVSGQPIFHSDAAQSLGKIPIDVRELPVHLMSFSAHKLHGPKGVGALYIKRGTRLKALLDGGGHEKGKRSGTLNVAGIVGFAKAIELAVAEQKSTVESLARLTRKLLEELKQQLGDVHLNGPPIEDRLPGNLNVSIEGIDAETLAMKIPQLCFSTGSACTSADPEPSHVLQGIGLDPMESRSSLRLSLSKFSTEAEMDKAVTLLVDNVRKLRSDR